MDCVFRDGVERVRVEQNEVRHFVGAITPSRRLPPTRGVGRRDTKHLDRRNPGGGESRQLTHDFATNQHTVFPLRVYDD